MYNTVLLAFAPNLYMKLRLRWLSFRSVALNCCFTVLMLLAAGCASSSPPRIVSDHVPAGSLRLTQVVYLATRQDIGQDPVFIRTINECGLRESDIDDGSFGFGEVFCCNGPNAETSATAFYVPRGMVVKLNDYAVVQIGYPAKNGQAGQVNKVVQVRGNAADPNCAVHWIPPQENLWRRILYADWMPAEGWIYQGGLWKTWYKPPPH